MNIDDAIREIEEKQLELDSKILAVRNYQIKQAEAREKKK